MMNDRMFTQTHVYADDRRFVSRITTDDRTLLFFLFESARKLSQRKPLGIHTDNDLKDLVTPTVCLTCKNKQSF